MIHTTIGFLGREAAEQFDSKTPYIVVSITDPGSDCVRFAPSKTRLAILQLSFHDIDEFHLKAELPTQIIVFDDTMARAVVHFVQAFLGRIDHILCHCEVGISRSAGLAAALAKEICGDDALFFRLGIPNRLVYRKVYEAWQKSMDSEA